MTGLASRHALKSTVGNSSSLEFAVCATASRRASICPTTTWSGPKGGEWRTMHPVGTTHFPLGGFDIHFMMAVM